MGDHAHLSIGEVLSLLQDEFPDVTISKIRFLESQGLLDPERTPSGYRKFYEPDIERLRWILLQQKEHFLPLKVIKDRLAEQEGGAEPPPGGEEAAGHLPGPGAMAGVGAESPVPIWMADAARAAAAKASETPSLPFGIEASALSQDEAAAATGGDGTKGGTSPEPERRPATPLDSGPTSVSLTLAELASASNLGLDQLRALENYGLVAGRTVGAEVYYDGDALVVAQKAAGFLRHGIEPRHLRMFKVAAEREAGFLEQVVMPMVKQRNPAARRQAVATLGELAALGQSLRAALLRRALRDHLP